MEKTLGKANTNWRYKWSGVERNLTVLQFDATGRDKYKRKMGGEGDTLVNFKKNCEKMIPVT